MTNYFTYQAVPYPVDEESPFQVSAYKGTDWPIWVLRPEGPPPGSAVATAPVTPGGIEFTGLEKDTKYFMGGKVGNEWRYRLFWTFEPERTNTAEEQMLEEARQVLDSHEAATKSVHGVSDFAAFLKAPAKVEAYTQTFATAGRTHAKSEVATNLPTNLNVITTLLGTLVGEVNATNKRVNELAEAVNENKKLTNALIDDSQAVGISK